MRRKKAQMEELAKQMKEMEAQGKSRKAIALALGVTAAQVTRTLQPVRKWKDRRLAA